MSFEGVARRWCEEIVRRVRRRGPQTIEELARAVARAERTLRQAKEKLQRAGGATNVVDEPWLPLDYPGGQIKIVASAYKRRLSVAKEPYTVEWLERSLRADDVLYDVGANVGAYALVAASCCPAAKVFAFEPGFETYAVLCRNIVLNGVGDRVVPLPIALGQAAGLVDFHYRRLGAGGARHHVGAAPPFEPAFTQHVLALRLDDLQPLLRLPLPTHLKLDVDGAELSVLEGGRGLLAEPTLRELHVEVEPGDGVVQRFVEDQGFDLVARNETELVVNLQFARRTT